MKANKLIRPTTQTILLSGPMPTANISRARWLTATMIVGLALLASFTTQAQFNFITLDDPLAGQGTYAQGVSGNNVVGFYYTPGGTSQGFLYNGSSYTTLNNPLGIGNTRAFGISGNNIVGDYANNSGQYAFRYNGSSYTTLSPALVDNTFATGISGNNIVGYYWDNNTFSSHGFFYNGSTYTTLDDPLAAPTQLFASGTYVTGISGNRLVGWYTAGPYNSPNIYGFLYDGTSFVTLSDPSDAGYMLPTGISGNNIIGQYEDGTGQHSFLFDGSTYTALHGPLGAEFDSACEFTGISGQTVVGNYSDSNGTHAFIATVPEPSTLALVSFGAAASIFHLKRNRSRTVSP